MSEDTLKEAEEAKRRFFKMKMGLQEQNPGFFEQSSLLGLLGGVTGAKYRDNRPIVLGSVFFRFQERKKISPPKFLPPFGRRF